MNSLKPSLVSMMSVFVLSSSSEGGTYITTL